MDLGEDVKIEEDTLNTALRLRNFRRELKEFRRKVKYPQKMCEVPDMIEKLEKEGLIPKPNYRLYHSYMS